MRSQVKTIIEKAFSPENIKNEQYKTCVKIQSQPDHIETLKKYNRTVEDFCEVETR